MWRYECAILCCYLAFFILFENAITQSLNNNRTRSLNEVITIRANNANLRIARAGNLGFVSATGTQKKKKGKISTGCDP